MSNQDDFNTTKLATSRLIFVTGSTDPAKASHAGVLIYSASSALDNAGGRQSGMLDNAGSDTAIFISGTVGSAPYSPKVTDNKTVFGGDLVISGS